MLKMGVFLAETVRAQKKQSVLHQGSTWCSTWCKTAQNVPGHRPPLSVL